MLTTDQHLAVHQTRTPQVGSRVTVWHEPTRMYVGQVEQASPHRMTVRLLDGSGTVSVDPVYVRTMENGS